MVGTAPWLLGTEPSLSSSGSSSRVCLEGLLWAAVVLELGERVSVRAGAALLTVCFGPVAGVEREDDVLGRADLVVTALRQRDTTA